MHLYLNTNIRSISKLLSVSFQGVCVTDGYQAYHPLDEKTPGLTIAGCWAHTRRMYTEALKVIRDKEKRKGALTYNAHDPVQAVYAEAVCKVNPV